ncbi:MAG: triose-phosphate isomerase [Candidatus Obscuribacterales bacterium]|nr:triose-phosphate isomerase [Candidatus Obscuribacterales bacterium]
MSTKRRTIIAGNWKMNKTFGEGKKLAAAIVEGVKDKKDLPEIVLCPPFTLLSEVTESTKDSAVKVGAQNMDYRDEGAYTGEVSPVMLTSMSVGYVLIGHSERRQFFGETNATVNLRLKAALRHDLVPIVCVGETLDEREDGLTDAVVRRQVAAALADIDETDLEKIVFAYEPVWAIGTGKTCEADEANRVAGLVRATVNEFYSRGESGQKNKSTVGEQIPVLYGGSVKASNVDEQLALEHIDGSLVGGASLTAQEFLPIIEAGAKRVARVPSKA